VTPNIILNVIHVVSPGNAAFPVWPTAGWRENGVMTLARIV